MGCDGMRKTEITVPVSITIGVFGNKNERTEKWLTKAIDQGVGYIVINDVQGEDPFQLIKVMTPAADHTSTTKYRQKANTELRGRRAGASPSPPPALVMRTSLPSTTVYTKSQ